MYETMEEQYLNHMQDLLKFGGAKGDRTGTGTVSIFGHQMRCDLQREFPLLTTKKVFTRGIIEELLWFLRGETNIKSLGEKDVHIWDEWADSNGNLGPVYGKQWRSWQNLIDVGAGADESYVNSLIKKGYEANEPMWADSDGDSCLLLGRDIDQIANLIEGLKINPTSRRHIVSAWNVGDLDQMALVPCHLLFQFNCRPLSTDQICQWYRDNHQEAFDNVVMGAMGSLSGLNSEEKKLAYIDAMAEDELIDYPQYYLDCQLYQRSADWFLGVPFNIASYAILTHMVAQVVGMVPGEFIHTFGDTHLYLNHLDQAHEQLSRAPYQPPKLKLNPTVEFIDDFTASDIVITGYGCHPSIKAPVAI